VNFNHVFSNNQKDFSSFQGALNWENRFHIDQYAFVAGDKQFTFINCDIGHLFRSAHQHTCIMLLTNALKPGLDKLQVYSCELQRVTPTVLSLVLIIIVFNGSQWINHFTYWKDCLALKKGPTGCPETSVRIYHYKMFNNPEERRFHSYRGGTPKSHRILPDIINLKYLNIFFYFLNQRL